jgi:hypothetical protein
MSNPTTVSVPHNLSREEVRRRLRSRVGELGRHIPGGVADLQTGWPSEDRMTLDIVAMSQRLSATLDIEDKAVRVTMILPPLLGMMSGLIARAVQEKGGQLLLGDESGTKV